MNFILRCLASFNTSQNYSWSFYYLIKLSQELNTEGARKYFGFFIRHFCSNYLHISPKMLYHLVPIKICIDHHLFLNHSCYFLLLNLLIITNLIANKFQDIWFFYLSVNFLNQELLILTRINIHAHFYYHKKKRHMISYVCMYFIIINIHFSVVLH